jgi:hypothetical protein
VRSYADGESGSYADGEWADGEPAGGESGSYADGESAFGSLTLALSRCDGRGDA